MILIIISIGALLLFSIKKFRQKTKKLARLVSLQKKEIDFIKEQLTNAKQELAETKRVKNKVITMILHDLRSPMRFLVTITNHLTVNFKKFESSDLEKKLYDLKNSTTALNNFAEQFFDWAAIQHEDFVLKIERIKIKTVISNITALYTPIAKANNNELLVLSTEVECYSDLQILSLILRNIIDNANKNTENGKIRISVVESNNYIAIIIEDSGKGMTNEEIEGFISESKIGAKKGSIGSTLIAGLLLKIDGQLQIQKNDPTGSKFIISIPRLLLAETAGKV